MEVVKQETTSTGRRQRSLKGASLYIGDLLPDVTEEDLILKFSSTVPVVSAHLCRCSSTGKSLRYAYINFDSRFSASNALACLNHTDLKGKPMRVMWYQKDQSQRQSGTGNLFVKNLDSSITSSCLERIFSPFGTILSCKVVEENGQSKGFGFVQFDSEQSAAAARCALHGSIINGKKLYVAKFIKKTERAATSGKQDFTNLYVKNLAEDVTEDFLLKKFVQYGRVSDVAVMRDGTGKSRGFGFVNFFQPENAKKATKALNGAVLGSKILFVGKAQTKAERTEMLKHELNEKFISGFKKLKWWNLYVKNLSESIDETRLQEIFGRYGRIISAKVMRHENGLSKGFGFVCFSSGEESKQAKRELNGIFVDGKSLVVRVAERKEDRLKRLQQYFKEPLRHAPHGFLPGFHFPQIPVRLPAQSHFPLMPGAYSYIQPFHFGQSSLCFGSQAFFPNMTSYLPVGQVQAKQNGNSQDKVNKRMVFCKITPSAYASIAGKTSDLKSRNVGSQKLGFSGGNKGADAEISSRVSTSAANLEQATSVLKAALLKTPNACGNESRKV